jgi:hypothetical protein
MSIEIKITDPHNEDKKTLIAIADFLMELAGEKKPDLINTAPKISEPTMFTENEIQESLEIEKKIASPNPFTIEKAKNFVEAVEPIEKLESWEDTSQPKQRKKRTTKNTLPPQPPITMPLPNSIPMPSSISINTIPQPENNAVTFPQITEKLRIMMFKKKITKEQVNIILQKYGIPSLPLLSTRHDVFIAFDAAIEEYNK